MGDLGQQGSVGGAGRRAFQDDVEIVGRTATEHLGSRPRLRPLRAMGLVVVHRYPPTHTARTGRLWGRPLGWIDVSQ